MTVQRPPGSAGLYGKSILSFYVKLLKAHPFDFSIMALPSTFPPTLLKSFLSAASQPAHYLFASSIPTGGMWSCSMILICIFLMISKTESLHFRYLLIIPLSSLEKHLFRTFVLFIYECIYLFNRFTSLCPSGIKTLCGNQS